MASQVIRSRNGIESMRKKESSFEKRGRSNVNVQRRRRFYSSGEAHVLRGTKVYDLTRDWLNDSDVNTFKVGSLLAVNTQEDSQLGLMVMESILRKYEVDRSDFDTLMDMGWAADEHAEIEELFNLALFAWNLEETVLEEKEEKTRDSLEEYFALLEESLQTRSYRARSNSTGSYVLQSDKEMKFSPKFNENILGKISQNSNAGRQSNEDTELNQSSKTIDVEYLQLVMKRHINEDRQNSNDKDPDKDPERTKNSFEIQELAPDIQNNSEELNSADLGSPVTIRSNTRPKSRDFTMVSLGTTVWAHDHTYCLICPTTETEENLETRVPIVTSESRDVVQLKVDTSSETPNKEINAPNKDKPESEANPGTMEAREIPYKVIPAETGSDEITTKLLDEPRNIPYKEVVKRNNDSSATSSEKPESMVRDKLHRKPCFESRDAHKPRDIPKTITRRKDNMVENSEEPKPRNRIDETPDTPTKKMRKATSSEGAGKLRSRDNTPSRDNTQTRDGTQPRDNTRSRDNNSRRDFTQPCNSTSLQPKSDQSNTPSPLRRSKRIKQTTPRRLDTHYY